MSVIERFEVRGAAIGGVDSGSSLELRISPDAGIGSNAEQGMASLSAFEATPIPWPIEPERLLDVWYSSPWLGAIGRLLGDALASAEYELEPSTRRPDGTPLGRGDGQVRHDERQYAQGMAWLEREDVGQDGLSLYSLPELVRALALLLDQTGNAFVEVVRNRTARAPMRLAILLPQYVSYAIRNVSGVARPMLYQRDPYAGEAWFVPFGSRRSGATNEREYLHQRLPNSVSNVYGLPPWIEARTSVEVDNAHRAYLRQFFRSHAAPRWMIEITQDAAWTGPQPTQQQVDDVRALITNYLSANAGQMAGRNLVLSYPGGIAVKISAMDQKIEDPTFGSTARNARDEILAVRHVSLINLGLPEGGYRATAELQSDNFERQVLQPFAAPIVAMLNRVLRTPPPSGLGITDYRLVAEFRDVDIIQQRIEAVVKAVGRPVLTGDEGRELLGYEPRGDDEVLVPAGLVPLAGLAAPTGPDTGEAMDDDEAMD